MTCGGIQKESRPITVCHWMSHWTPQLETTLAPRSPHSAARLHASDASATAAVAVDEWQLAEKRGPGSQERRFGLEPRRDRLAGRPPAGEETPELVQPGAVGLDQVIHDLVDRPLARDRRARLLRRQRRQELVEGTDRVGDPFADHRGR